MSEAVLRKQVKTGTEVLAAHSETVINALRNGNGNEYAALHVMFTQRQITTIEVATSDFNAIKGTALLGVPASKADVLDIGWSVPK